MSRRAPRCRRCLRLLALRFGGFGFFLFGHGKLVGKTLPSLMHFALWRLGAKAPNHNPFRALARVCARGQGRAPSHLFLLRDSHLCEAFGWFRNDIDAGIDSFSSLPDPVVSENLIRPGFAS